MVVSSSKQIKLLRPLTGAWTSLQPLTGPGRSLSLSRACFRSASTVAPQSAAAISPAKFPEASIDKGSFKPIKRPAACILTGSFFGKKKPVWLSYANCAWARVSGPVNGVIPADATKRSQSTSRWWVPWIVLKVTFFTLLSPWAKMATHPRKNRIFFLARSATKPGSCPSSLISATYEILRPKLERSNAASKPKSCPMLKTAFSPGSRP